MTKVGVIGVGSMGSNHVRVYSNMPDVDLVGIVDQDQSRAAEVADTYDTSVFSRAELLDRVEAASVVVPTAYHYEVAQNCIDAGVDLLVEKPFVADPDRGKQLIEAADKADVEICVGHVERFNPAVMGLDEILADKNVLAYEVRRLGPDPGRDIQDSVVTDLMIHDLDIIRNLAGGNPTTFEAAGRADEKHATATLSFENDVIATLTASRVTQRKIRELGIATEEGYVNVDYLDRSIEIYSGSMKQLVETETEPRYRHESIIERPIVENTEPLKNELQAFVAASDGETNKMPAVSAEDGLEAVKLALAIEEKAFEETT
jgi:predicted dehydrogenase